MIFKCGYIGCTNDAVVKISDDKEQVNLCSLHSKNFQGIVGYTFSEPDHGGLRGPHDDSGIRLMPEDAPKE